MAQITPPDTSVELSMAVDVELLFNEELAASSIDPTGVFDRDALQIHVMLRHSEALLTSCNGRVSETLYEQVKSNENAWFELEIRCAFGSEHLQSVWLRREEGALHGCT